VGLRDLFRSREDNFFRLLSEQAAKTLEGMQALQEYVKALDQEAGQRVGQIEKEADEIRRILIDELNRTFITPIDREDIFALSRAIDDVLDYGYSTVDEMMTMGVKPNPYLCQLTAVLREGAEKLHLSVQRLRDHPNVAMSHATRAKMLENQAESIYREAVAALFKGAEKADDVKHVIDILKMREIYRHLSNAADRGDEAANIISDIVVKMT
jgi:predicted phosphate transport protein (TIGR00153 family)